MEKKQYKQLEDNNFIIVLEKEIELEIPKKYTLIKYGNELFICTYIKCSWKDCVDIDKITNNVIESIPLSRIERIKYKRS